MTAYISYKDDAFYIARRWLISMHYIAVIVV